MLFGLVLAMGKQFVDAREAHTCRRRGEVAREQSLHGLFECAHRVGVEQRTQADALDPGLLQTR